LQNSNFAFAMGLNLALQILLLGDFQKKNLKTNFSLSKQEFSHYTKIIKYLNVTKYEAFFAEKNSKILVLNEKTDGISKY